MKNRMHGDFSSVRAVLFDVDGVLLDSLPQHLRFCSDKAREYGLTGIRIPSVESFKAMASAGIPTSPMLQFFLALDFPLPLAKRGVEDYQLHFAKDYRPRAFPGVLHMLEQLSSAGKMLGLVTANTRRNVEGALLNAMPYFEPSWLYYFDRYTKPRSKAWCLTDALRVMEFHPSDAVYVGDQPSDVAAAHEAGLDFLGVSYGWGLRAEEAEIQTVGSVKEIAEKLLS